MGNAAAEEGTGTQIADDSIWSWALNLKDWCELFSSLKADGYLLRASLSKKVRIPATCATPSPPPFPPFWSSPQDAGKRHHKRKAVGHPWGSEDLIPINTCAAQGRICPSKPENSRLLRNADPEQPRKPLWWWGLHPACPGTPLASPLLELSPADSSIQTLGETVPSRTLVKL